MVCVGGFVGIMERMVLGCGKQVPGVRAAKTTIYDWESLRVWGFDFSL